MKRNTFCIVILLFSVVGIAAQSTDKAVEGIRKRYTDLAEKARLAETDDDQGEFGELVMNELTINSRHHQWRAVGIYGQTFKFFYKGGDDEKHLYPDQLVMVKAERKVSSRVYSEEYLFSDNGVLLFYFQKAENDDQVPAERRVYFSGIKAIRIIEDGKARDKFTAAELKNIAEIKRTAGKIADLFNRSINL